MYICEQYVRFGPWKYCRQTPIILHIARKCKLPTFGLWKKSEQGEITFEISMKVETHWDLHANASGHKEITMQIAGKSKLVRFELWKNCWQMPIIRLVLPQLGSAWL